MEIKVGTFGKEINSTKQVDESTLTTIDVQLKDDCSFLSPVIILERSVYNTSWNYCIIPMWNRSYFLHDAIFQTGSMVEVQLAIDVLGTWKTYILNSTAYVRRSASHYSDKIPDPSWSHDSDIYYNTQEINVGFDSTGYYLLYVTNDDNDGTTNDAVPAMTVYAMTRTQLKNFCNYMFSSAFFNNAKGSMDTTTEALAKMVFNPFQYVVRCMWIPFTPADYLAASETFISFGWWDPQDAMCRGSLLDEHKWTNTFTFTLDTYDDWTDRDPAWTRNLLYVPGFGQIEVSCAFQGQQLTCELIVDLATGEAGLFIWSASDGNNELIQTATGKVGADVQLSALYEDMIQDLGGNLAGTAMRAVSGAVVSAGAGLKQMWQGVKDVFHGNGTLKDVISNASETVASAVQGAQSAMQPTCSTIGANGSRAITDTKYKAIYTCTKYKRLQDNHISLGGMHNQTQFLRNLSGYTEIVNPRIQAPCTSGETTMINAFLTGGFYIE